MRTAPIHGSLGILEDYWLLLADQSRFLEEAVASGPSAPPSPLWVRTCGYLQALQHYAQTERLVLGYIGIRPHSGAVHVAEYDC